VSIEGAHTVSEEALRAIVHEKLAGRVALLFPKRSVFFYPEASIEAALLSAFPELQSAELSLTDPTSLTVRVSERLPAALLCSRESEVVTPCYFLDRHGYAFAESPDFSGSAYVRFYDGTPPSIGSQVLAPELFEQVLAFTHSLKELSLTPSELRLSPEGNYDVVLEGGAYIKISSDVGFLEARDNLASILSSDAFAGRDIEELEYIDLRFGNKVYYKK
jgi:hypothetical protein